MASNSKRSSDETALKAALYDLVSAAGNFERQNAELAQTEDMLHEAILHLQASRAWKERAMPLIKMIADGWYLLDEDGDCVACGEYHDDGHMPDCAVTQARVLLAESEASE